MVEPAKKIGQDLKGREAEKPMKKEKTKTLAAAFKEVDTLSDEVKKLIGGRLSSDKEKALARLESYIKHQIFKNPKEFGLG